MSEALDRLVWTGKPGSVRLWHHPELAGEERQQRLGRADCGHAGQVVAGAATALEFVYEPPTDGLIPGSLVRFAWSWPFDWRPAGGEGVAGEVGADVAAWPVVARIDGATNGPIPVDHVQRGAFDPWQHHLEVALGGGLEPGQELRVATGGDGWQAPTFTCGHAPFIAAVWTPHTARWQLVGRLAGPRVVGGAPCRAIAIAPGDAVVGEAVVVRVRVEDRWGNATAPAGRVERRVDASATELGSVTTENDPPVSVARLRFTEAGIQRVSFDVADVGTAITNPVLVHASAPASRLFFGDLHSGQTDVGCGAGSLADHFRHARAAGLQFASQQANDHYVTRQRWASIRRDTAAADVPGEFVAFLGCEWSPPTADGGDRNLIYWDDDEQRLRRSGRHYAEEGAATDAAELELDLPTAPVFHDAFRQQRVLVNLHVGGRPTNLEWHEPVIEPLFEIHSTHATSEWFVEEALQRGYRVGITGGADGIYGRPGADHPGWRQNRNVRSGLTGVYAERLDKASLWEAFFARRCYATTGERIGLRVEVAGEPMGGEVDTAEDSVEVSVAVSGTAPIEGIDVLRGTQVVHSREMAGPSPDGALRILWRGSEKRGTARDQRVVWDGALAVDGARVTAAEPVGFPSPDDVVRIEDAGRRVVWRSATAGNRAGVVIQVAGHDTARLRLSTAPCSLDVALGEVRRGVHVEDAGGVKRAVEIGPAPDGEAAADAEVTLPCPLPKPGDHPVWVRVVQLDGATAWSSPVTVRYRQEVPSPSAGR